MNNNGDKWLVILAVLLIAACIIGPILIWRSDLPIWLKWLPAKGCPAGVKAGVR